MKKVIGLCFLILIILFYSGFFLVKSNQVAIITNKYNNKIVVSQPGINFIIPFFEHINYLDINDKSDLLVMSVVLKDNNNQPISCRINIMVNWNIIYPINYFRYVQLNSDLQFINQIRQIVQNLINQKLQYDSSLDVFNETINFTGSPILINNLGVKLNMIKLVQLIPLKQYVKTNYSNKMSESLPAFSSNYVAISQMESAYYIAQNIIAQTAIKKANLYEKVEKADWRFYNYYTKVQLYKQAAKSKADIPPLNTLY